MPLALPNERHSINWFGALLAVAVVVGLCVLGCASAPPPSPRPTPAVAPAGDPGAAFVERALRRRGLRFGTDGSVRALWGYLSHAHHPVALAAARAGDVLFFDTRPGADAPSCDSGAGRTGIVEAVARDGRITFVEERDGRVRTSFADPANPALRRNARGEIANTFLRAKTATDPGDTRYLAGEMFCGAVRADHR